MLAERNVSVRAMRGSEPCGGQGSRALSRPMRVDSPAARITPQKLGARVMRARYHEPRAREILPSPDRASLASATPVRSRLRRLRARKWRAREYCSDAGKRPTGRDDESGDS